VCSFAKLAVKRIAGRMRVENGVALNFSACCVPVCPVSAIFALDDLPEKWKHFTEINASYVQDGKFMPAEFAKHHAPQSMHSTGSM